MRSPLQIHGGSGACPGKDVGELVPVGHGLVVKMFHWCARDNHAIELLVTQKLEVLVEGTHVLHGRVLRGVTLDLHQREVQLQGRVGKHTHEVRLGGDFDGHQVQHHDAQGTDVL